MLRPEPPTISDLRFHDLDQVSAYAYIIIFLFGPLNPLNHHNMRSVWLANKGGTIINPLNLTPRLLYSIRRVDQSHNNWGINK